MLGSTDCEMLETAQARHTVAQFDEPFELEARSYAPDQPLVAIAEGFGLRHRSGLRRLFFLAQAVNDPADPVNYVRHMQREPLVQRLERQGHTSFY